MLSLGVWAPATGSGISWKFARLSYQLSPVHQLSCGWPYWRNIVLHFSGNNLSLFLYLSLVLVQNLAQNPEPRGWMLPACEQLWKQACSAGGACVGGRLGAGMWSRLEAELFCPLFFFFSILLAIAALNVSNIHQRL